jgi:cytochrome P450
VLAVLRDAATFHNGRPQTFRRVQSLFTPRAARLMEPALKARAAELVDAVAVKGGCEAIAEVAIPFAAAARLEWFGFPLSERDRFWDLLDAWSRAPDTDRAWKELCDYLARLIFAQVRDGASPMLSMLLVDDSLTDIEIAEVYMLLAGGGTEPVAAATGYALLELAVNPELREFLRENPDQAGAFSEEIIRLSCPITGVSRVTTRDVEIGGVTLPPGSLVHLRLRPPTIEDSGDEITIADGKIRRHRHWGFGGGPSRCVGMHLARLEMRVILEEWLKRIPEFELAADYTTEEIEASGAVRLTTLPLRW